MRRFGHWPLGHTLQSKFSPFYNLKFHSFRTLPVWVQNFEISIARYSWGKLFPENVSELTSFKSARNFFAIRPEMKSTKGNKCYCHISTIAYNVKTSMHFFVQMCSPISKFSVLLNHPYRVLIAFSGKMFFSWIPCYWNFEFLHSIRKCAKWVEMTGCKMDLTCSVRYSLARFTFKMTLSLVSAWRFVLFSNFVVSFRKMQFLRNS